MIKQVLFVNSKITNLSHFKTRFRKLYFFFRVFGLSPTPVMLSAGLLAPATLTTKIGLSPTMPYIRNIIFRLADLRHAPHNTALPNLLFLMQELDTFLLSLFEINKEKQSRKDTDMTSSFITSDMM